MRAPRSLGPLVALAALAGCGDAGGTSGCGPGTTNQGGACVADVICPDAAPYDPSTGACMLSAGACGPGTMFAGGRCVPAPPEPPLEAAEPNDRGGGAGRIALGAAITGCINPYADANNDGILLADRDSWALSVNAPTLVRITSAGSGGLEPAVAISSLDFDLNDDEWSRARVDTRDGQATWTLLLPAAGDYEVAVQDANTLASAGLAVGRPDACYSLTFAALPLPTPAALPSALASLPLDAPSFFTFAPGEGMGLDLAAETARTSTLASIVMLVNGAYAGSTAESALDGPARLQASFHAGDRVLVVVEAAQAPSPPAERADFLATVVPAP